MATKFSDLYPFIRAVLGDMDSQKPMYTTAVLDSHLRLAVLQQSPVAYQESGSTKQFDKDLTPLQKAKLVYQVSKAIVSQLPSNFSYRTPVMSASRSGVGAQLLAYISQQLDGIEGGIPLAYDTELNVILNGAYRFYNSYLAAALEPIVPSVPNVVS